MIAIKAVAGAMVVLLITLLSRTKYTYLALLVPMFPTFTLIAQVTLGGTRSGEQLKTAMLFGMWTLLPLGLYLASVYFLVDRMKLEVALLCSALVWVAAAAMLVVIWGRVYA